jgi:hypothetical protein
MEDLSVFSAKPRLRALLDHLAKIKDPQQSRKVAYVPRTVRLHYDLANPTDRRELEQRCRTLTNEMLFWLADPEDGRKPVYDGTIVPTAIPKAADGHLRIG